MIAEPSDQAGHRIRRGNRGGCPPRFDATDYRNRNVIERRFCHLKQWRGLATRHGLPLSRRPQRRHRLDIHKTRSSLVLLRRSRVNSPKLVRDVAPRGHRNLTFHHQVILPQTRDYALKEAEALNHSTRSNKLRHVGN